MAGLSVSTVREQGGAMRPGEAVRPGRAVRPESGSFPVVVHLLVVVVDGRVLLVRERGGGWQLPSVPLPCGGSVFDVVAELERELGGVAVGASVVHTQLDRTGDGTVRLFVLVPEFAGDPTAGAGSRFEEAAPFAPGRLPTSVPLGLESAVGVWRRGGEGGIGGFSEFPAFPTRLEATAPSRASGSAQ